MGFFQVQSSGALPGSASVRSRRRRSPRPSSSRLHLVPLVVDGPGSAYDAFRNVFVFVPLRMLLAGAAIGWVIVWAIRRAILRRSVVTPIEPPPTVY